MGRVLLVTGVCRDLGGRYARRLAGHPAVDRVIGVDVVPPRHDLGDVRFVRADIRNPVIAKVMAAEDVDTVVHLGVIATPLGAGGRTLMKEINVIGTMQLLAACQRASGVKRLVVKSSAHVYGASPNDPAMFTEDMAPKRTPRSGFGKDSVEVEGYVRGFARRRPDVTVTMLRCANLMGPQIETSLTRYFSLPVVPTVLGYDARLQFCHEEDALAALERAAVSGVDGTFNVAGDGVLMLSQAVRRAGRPELPLPPALLSALGSALPQLRGAEMSAEQVSFLTYGRGIDTRQLRTTFGFEPRFSTADAFTAFARRVRPGVVNSARLEQWERQAQEAVSQVVSHARR
ncbi:MAG: UDP-glucose 4-epimerase [Nocardioidaceae bacterium]|jgi:UDP-glucose 4-epimerase|nr:UDP-glucose 4-epimerase [Nocardioidaceae bacterium]MDX6308089.1 UDP-glucose 4-epimerase [Nocardioidaceae bacterium]